MGFDLGTIAGEQDEILLIQQQQLLAMGDFELCDPHLLQQSLFCWVHGCFPSENEGARIVI
ncbi:hypothetical protein D3C85_1915520 [compost metagenome]